MQHGTPTRIIGNITRAEVVWFVHINPDAIHRHDGIECTDLVPPPPLSLVRQEVRVVCSASPKLHVQKRKGFE